MSRSIRLAHLAGALSAIVIGSLASGATLVDFKPLPVSSTLPEFIFSGPVGSPSFKSGPGVTGNADGVLPVSAQTPGGIDAEASFIIPGIPGSAINAITGTTEFFDSTLVLSGLVANAPAGSSGPVLVQSLGAGSFSLFSTDPDGPGALLPTLLLSGTIASSSFIAGVGNAASEFNSQGVTYTGGVIFAALVASGGSPGGNSMSISMTDVTPGLSIDPSDGFLDDFTANGTGLYNYVVPEPASISMLALAATMMFRRRARRA